MSALAARTGWRLVAFGGLTALAAWRYCGVIAPAPNGRMAALGVIALLAATATVVLQGRGQWAVLRWLALALAVALALVAAGVPGRLLAPAKWSTLARLLDAGLGDIGSTLWPYSGGGAWTRVDLLLGPALTLIAAAALAFWPARPAGRLASARRRLRGGAALALLLGVYVLGLLDSNGGSIAVEGVLLLALIGAWVWLPGLPGRRAAAAVVWLLVAGAAAAALSAGLAARQPWFNYRGWNVFGAAGGGIAFTWDQTYGPIRWSRSEQTMFTVSAPRAQLWKTTTLDRFDGSRWVRSGTPQPGAYDLPLPLNANWYRFARFTIADLRSGLLPVEQGATEGVNAAEQTAYASDGTVATTRPPLRSGAAYTVLSYVPDPAPAEMRAAPRTLPPGYGRYTEFQLPAVRRPVTARDSRPLLASPYAPMYRLARQLATGKRSPYDVARATQQYLQRNDAYLENVPVRRYPLESFLFTDHVGYCQQFSGAMALMLRMDGIPARIAAGFLPGSYDAASRQWVVRAVDAHSWVEVYFKGIGWVAFNPTPPRVIAPLAQPVFESERTAAQARLAAIAATVGSPPPTSSEAATHAGGGSGWPFLAALTLGLLAALSLAARWMAGRSALRRSLDDDGELAVRELVQAMRRLGIVLPATATLTRVEAMVRLHGGPEAAAYVRGLRDRRYGAGAGLSATLAGRRRLRRGLTARRGLDSRLRGLWALPPGTAAWRAGRGHPGGP